MPYHTIPYHTILYHTIPYYTMPYHTILYHAILYYTIQHHTILYHPISISNFLPMQVLKCCVIAIFVVGIIPFLLGLIFELVVVSPLRVGMDQSPLYFPAQVSEKTYSSISNTAYLSVFHLFLFYFYSII